MSDNYKVGDLVWAKMKGFPPWPGRVTEPGKDTKKTPKKNAQWIYFFGSSNYSWIETNSIKPYERFKESLSKANKTSSFTQACAAIEEYIAKGDPRLDPVAETSSEEAFDNLIKSTTPVIKPRKPRKSETPKTSSTPAETTEKSSTETETPSGEKKPKPAKSTEKKVKVKRSQSPPVNGDTPAKKKKKLLLDTPLKSTEVKSKAIMTVYKGNEEKKAAKLTSQSRLADNIEHIVMDQDPTQPNSSPFNFGFLGLGIMGSGIVNNLLQSGHKVVVWNRSPDKVDEFSSRGADVAKTPAEVVHKSDIIFSCVSDPNAAKELIFGNNGVLTTMDSTKGYVELTTIDADTSLDIADAIKSKGGRYLEAQLQGSKKEAEEGTLVLLCAGDRPLYEDTQTCFLSMAKCSFFLGDAGSAVKMNLVIQLIMGITLGALAEGMSLAESAGLRQADVLEIMTCTTVTSPLVVAKAKQIIDSLFVTSMPLKHMQKDLTLSLALGDVLEHPLPLTATANEIYKHARKLGYSSHDASAVYIRAKF